MENINIIKNLKWRHAIKKYDPNKQVSEENKKIILEALRLTPSSINSQPWKFIVVASKKAKQRLSKTFTKDYPFNEPHILESSFTILLTHNPSYDENDYWKVINKSIQDGRLSEERKQGSFSGSFNFVKINTDEKGNNSSWTKAQLYIALGNLHNTLATMRIGSTPMEGVNPELISKEFKNELNGYICEVAVAIGYSSDSGDYNAKLPKSRLEIKDIIVEL